MSPVHYKLVGLRMEMQTVSCAIRTQYLNKKSITSSVYDCTVEDVEHSNA